MSPESNVKEPGTIKLRKSEHKEGCPRSRSDEVFQVDRPLTEGRVQTVVVVRCVDCSGQKVYDGDIASVATTFKTEERPKNGEGQANSE